MSRLGFGSACNYLVGLGGCKVVADLGIVWRGHTIKKGCTPGKRYAGVHVHGLVGEAHRGRAKPRITGGGVKG